MSPIYAKIYDCIFDSSLAEDYQVRHVFEDLLKLADQDGTVNRTHEAIARRTNVPLEIIKRAIIELEKPDPRSQSTELDGRRIVRLDTARDWGWKIVNHGYYRQLRTADDKRQQDRLRQQAFRKRKATKRDNRLQNVTSAYAYASDKDILNNGEAHDWTLQECLNASSPLGLPHAEVEKFYQHFSAQGWVTGAGRPITNLASKLGQWKTKYMEERTKQTQVNRGPNI